jgi:hypothetical protein
MVLIDRHAERSLLDGVLRDVRASSIFRRLSVMPWVPHSVYALDRRPTAS